MKTEIWKDVVGYKGLYQVSNLGRIKSLPRNGTVKTDVYLKARDNGKGYMQVSLRNGTPKTKYVHIIVAESFLDYKANKGVVCVDHINSIKNDNKLDNLRVITPRENVSRYNRSNTNTTGVYKVRNRYRAIISVKNTRYDLGYFDNIESAKLSYELKLNQITNEQ
jgi:hypothetical protein